MATTTTNLVLSKPEYSDAADIAVINGNMDKLDAAVSKTGGIIINGNKTATGVTAAVGDYVMLVNSTISGRADGFYTVKTAIPANTAIDSTYLNETSPLSKGAFNSLNGKVTDGLLFTNTTITNLDNAPIGWFYAASTVTNVPSAHAYFVITMRGGAHATQFAICRNANAAYIRRCASGTWHEWKQVSLV